MNSVSKTFLLLGLTLLFFGSYLIFQRYSPKKLAFQNYKAENTVLAKNAPNILEIPSLNIYLPLIPSKINKNNWEATTLGVSYLASSPLPGEEGNSILYGHNWESLLGPLTKIKPGQEIKISFRDNSAKTFVVKYTQVVTSDQTHILNQTKDKRITIYTCTGFLDLKRFAAVALLKT